MKARLLRLLLLCSTYTLALLSFLTCSQTTPAGEASQTIDKASSSWGVPAKESYQLTTRLTVQSAIKDSLPFTPRTIEIVSTPKQVEMIRMPDPTAQRKKKKASTRFDGFSGLAGAPFQPGEQATDLYGDGYPSLDDNDEDFKRPPYFPARQKGDFTLTLLPVLRIPSDWRSILSGNHWLHWVMGETDYESGLTLHVSFNGEPSSVITISQAEYQQMAEHLGDAHKLLQWLAPKLSGREAFVRMLLEMAEQLPKAEETTRENIEKQIAALVEWPDQQLNLEFEWQQLGQALAGIDNLDLSEDRKPDTGTVYEGEEVERFIQQMPLFNWWRRESFQGQAGSDSNGGSQGGAGSSPAKKDIVNNDSDEQGDGYGNERTDAAYQAGTGSGKRPVSIVLFGKMSTGKSSIADRLIGFEHFPRMLGETKEEQPGGEPLYSTPAITIRSFPGYNGDSISDEEYDDFIVGKKNEKYRITDADIVIYVLNKVVDREDKKFIRKLVANQKQRIIFVHNKYHEGLVGYIKQQGLSISNISEIVGEKGGVKPEYEQLVKGFVSTTRENLTRRLGEIKANYLPLQIFMECDENKCTEGNLTLVHAISTIIQKEERTNWNLFSKTRFLWKPELPPAFISHLKEYITNPVTDRSSSVDEIDRTYLHWFKEYVNEHYVGQSDETYVRPFASDQNLVKFISVQLQSLSNSENRERLLKIKNEILEEATSTLIYGLTRSGALGLGWWGLVAAVLVATPADELVAMGLLSSATAGTGTIMGAAALGAALSTAVIIGMPVALGLGGWSIYQWWNHDRWAKEKAQDAVIIKAFSIAATTISLHMNSFRQRAFDQLWHETGALPELDQEGRIVKSTQVRSEPIYDELDAPPARDVQIERERQEEALTTIAFHVPIGSVQHCRSWMKDFPAIKEQLKKLAEMQLGQAGVITEQMHKNGYFKSGIIIPLLYASGADPEKIKEITSGDRILDILQNHGFAPIREHIFETLPDPIKDERLLNTIELAVLLRNRPEGRPAFLEDKTLAETPLIVFQKVASPSLYPKQYKELLKITATQFHRQEYEPEDAITSSIKAMKFESEGALLHYPQNKGLQTVQITEPAHGISGQLLKVAARTADWIFSMGNWMDRVTYDALPANDPKRTRIHRIGFLAEPLYGIHLKNKEVFDDYIGEMTEPVIAAVNGYDNTNIWHAFLLFRNSKSGEFNTLHIRQGSYYPEFMDKNATLRYFREEKKQLKDAFSVGALANLYYGTVNTDQLRSIFAKRCSQAQEYRMTDQNCMTFSMLALDATPLNREELLKTASPQGVHSPYHIMQALRRSDEKDHSTAMYEAATKNRGLPDWLINPAQE